MKKTVTFLGLCFVTIACSQTKENRIFVGKESAQSELNEVLKTNKKHNVIDNKTLIIKNTDTAVKIAEPILFGIYGKKNIEEQKPYEAHKLDNYYVISGTLPKGDIGGTFIIIIDGTNSKVLKISHGK